MSWYGLWEGGNSYAHSEVPGDVEVFPSLAEAKEELVRRFDGYGTFLTWDGQRRAVQTPAVDADSHLILWPKHSEIPETPDTGVLIEFGPRGGVRKSTF